MNVVVKQANKGYDFAIIYDEFRHIDFEKGSLKSTIKNIMPYFIVERDKYKVHVILNLTSTTRISYIQTRILDALYKLDDLSYNSIYKNFRYIFKDLIKSDNFFSEEQLSGLGSFILIAENNFYILHFDAFCVETDKESYVFGNKDYNTFLFEIAEGITFKRKVKDFIKKKTLMSRDFPSGVGVFIGNTEKPKHSFLYGKNLNKEHVIPEEVYQWVVN